MATLISRKSDRAYDEKWCGYHNKKSQTIAVELPVEVVEFVPKGTKYKCSAFNVETKPKCLETTFFTDKGMCGYQMCSLSLSKGAPQVVYVDNPTIAPSLNATQLGL